MKKLIAWVIVLVVLFAGCAAPADLPSETTSAPTVAPTVTVALTPTPTLKPTPTPTIKPTSAPTVAPTPIPPDFFDDAERLDSIKASLERSAYNEILQIAEEYINTTENILPNDNIYHIVDLCTQAVDLLDECEITQDEFTGEVIIRYKNVEGISKAVSLFPSLEDNSLELLIGFKASEWVFFVEYSIKVDGGYIDDYYDYFSITRDVVSGGVIEYVSTSLTADEIKQICNTEKPMIRFEGDDDKYYDHAITDAEKAALETIHTLREIYVTISNEIFHKQNG